MEIKEYTANKSQFFPSLVERIYEKYPHLVQAKISEFLKVQNQNNPFFRYGSVRNFALLNNNRPIAHVSIFTDERLPNSTVTFGFFECKNSPNQVEAFFLYIRDKLRAEEISQMYGPINVNTWQNFRISVANTNPPFFTEPYNPQYYANMIKKCGGSLVQKNVSTVHPIDFPNEEKAITKHRILEADGFKIEQITKLNFNSALKDIFELLKICYKDTLLFYPITWEEFCFLYQDLKRIAGNELSVLVRDISGKTVAFCVAYPDLINPERKKMIIKNMAVLPEYQNKGIATVAFSQVHKIGKKAGYTSVIYSTMKASHEKILVITQTSDNIYREYELYQINL